MQVSFVDCEKSPGKQDCHCGVKGCETQTDTVCSVQMKWALSSVYMSI